MKQVSILLTIMFLLSLSVSAQEQTDSTKQMHKMMKGHHSKMMNKDSTKHKMQGMKHMHKMDSTKMDHMNHGEMDMKKSTIIHEGEIDLLAIDKNGDKKVFQDQMDWNVISDEAGSCPICEMKLKEVSIYDAKVKLLEKGFKVKDFSGQ